MAPGRDLRYTEGMKALAGFAVAIALSLRADAATQTYVSLAGRDDTRPKLGRPGITVNVQSAAQGEAIFVMNEVHRGLGRLVHTRPLAAGERGDYELDVRLELSSVNDAVRTIPFAAWLTSAEGERIWRVEGRSETTDPATDPSAYVSIGRNIVSALIHDGWLVPRVDPNDPPPAPPKIRMDDSAR